MKLIDKAAVVAEIEKTYNFHEKRGGKNDASICDVLYGLLHRINTLEVKEVDLKKYYHDFLQKEWFGRNCVRTMSEMMAFTAKHFFELGLKAQKGE